MTFHDFVFPEVGERFGLTMRDGDLFPNSPRVTPTQGFAESLRDGYGLAQANCTEKAKSELVIAPILLELWRMTDRRFKLFSGAQWAVDPMQGLHGCCDFLMTHGPSQFFVTTPFAVIAAAKDDLYANGFGSCIAAMYAATLVATKDDQRPSPIYGAVTHGRGWKFLRIDRKVVTIDVTEYGIVDLSHLFGVLDLITRVPASLAA